MSIHSEHLRHHSVKPVRTLRAPASETRLRDRCFLGEYPPLENLFEGLRIEGTLLVNMASNFMGMSAMSIFALLMLMAFDGVSSLPARSALDACGLSLCRQMRLRGGADPYANPASTPPAAADWSTPAVQTSQQDPLRNSPFFLSWSMIE